MSLVTEVELREQVRLKKNQVVNLIVTYESGQITKEEYETKEPEIMAGLNILILTKLIQNSNTPREN